MDPASHRTGDIWHIWVRGIAVGQLYGYRIEGPYQPEEGHRFNPHKLLLDPYARALAGVKNWDFAAARGYDYASGLTPHRNVLLPAKISTGSWILLQSIRPPIR
jgi:isoamylase